MSFIYLASPYSNPDPLVVAKRFHMAKDCLGFFLRKRIWMYAPIVHCHQLALDHKLPGDHKFWQEYDETMIQASSGVYVLMVDGWKTSLGVTSEIEFAKLLGLRLRYVLPRAGDLSADEEYSIQRKPEVV